MCDRGESIVDNPAEFARRWYKVDEIYYGLLTGGELVAPVPDDTRSIEFARWLAGEYQLAMVKGAQLAVDEVRAREIERLDRQYY